MQDPTPKEHGSQKGTKLGEHVHMQATVRREGLQRPNLGAPASRVQTCNKGPNKGYHTRV
jgi:hypothetical protein